MTHEEALRDTLAGGLAPAGAGQHIASCAACRLELESLLATEDRLRSCAPPALPSHRLESRVLSRSLPPRHAGWAKVSAAAVLLVAAALSVAWLGRGGTPATVATSASSPPIVTLPYDDSTAGLLGAYEPLAAALPQLGMEDLSPYLNPPDPVGWNG